MQSAVVETEILRFVIEKLTVTHFLSGAFHIPELWLTRAPGLGGDRRDQVHILFAVAELDPPGDDALFFVAVNADTVTQGSKVSITADVDSVLWAGLNTGITLPAHTGFYVVGTPVGLIDVHNVGRADIHAVAAPVAPCHVNKSRHLKTLSCLEDFEVWVGAQ